MFHDLIRKQTIVDDRTNGFGLRFDVERLHQFTYLILFYQDTAPH